MHHQKVYKSLSSTNPSKLTITEIDQYATTKPKKLSTFIKKQLRLKTPNSNRNKSGYINKNKIKQLNTKNSNRLWGCLL